RSVLILICQSQGGWIGYVILFFTDVCMLSLLISWKKMLWMDCTGFFIGIVLFVILLLKKLLTRNYNTRDEMCLIKICFIFVLGKTTDSELNRIRKYWVQRYLLYTRFDAGILLDHESFYSVCPEILARHIAERYCRFPNGVAVDPFCGAGGNVIQLAKTCGKVIAMDIDGSKIKLARHNARIYGCDNIEFRQNDYFHGPI
ncbi:RNA cap guanine-N2 methyltransferase,S-adenosyl-L-methionine-dependent methyltransferase, partial [Cinara cedri]